MSDDAIDLHVAVIHNGPSEIAAWPVTTLIERLTMRPGQNNGLSFTFGGNQTWPDYVPPGWTGPIQYTVWAGVQIRGEWHVAGFIQMWRTRPSTGAPILAQWGDWAYDRNRWREMVDYRPQAGDKMIFFLSAGNARKGSAGPEPDVTSVRERSNVVMVGLPAGDDGTFAFAPAPAVAITQAPLSPTTHAIDLDIVLEEIHKLDAKIQILTEAVSALRSSVA
jgi:hypothetical protein